MRAIISRFKKPKAFIVFDLVIYIRKVMKFDLIMGIRKQNILDVFANLPLDDINIPSCSFCTALFEALHMYEEADLLHHYNAIATAKIPAAPAKPAAIAPVGRVAPASALELCPAAASSAAPDVVLIAIELEAVIEDPLAIDALESMLPDDAELPLIADDPDASEALLLLLPVSSAPAELVAPLIFPAAVANPPKPEYVCR